MAYESEDLELCYGNIQSSRDPSCIFPKLEDGLNACLPLRNLHWNSSTRPLRSIKSLHVELKPETDNSGRNQQNGRGRSSEGTRTSSSTDASRKERRHQMPGLRQTPYLRIYFLRCADIDTYRNSARAALREWVSLQTANRADGSSLSKQENHDASEWLIVLVEGEGLPSEKAAGKADGEATKKTSTSRWKPKTSKSVIEKLRTDFNTQPKNSVDRTALLNLGQQTQVPDETGGSSTVDFSDLMSQMKALILSSFDRRVHQYEEDIREREQQQNMPGWNFNTFFILKEGLARGFESVGLLEDAFSSYQELATGLDALVAEQSDDKQGARSAIFSDCTDDLQRAISRAVQEMYRADSGDKRLSLNFNDLGLQLFDTDRKPFRNLILENNISIFDFKCYVFARQVALLLRQANARITMPQRSLDSPEDAKGATTIDSKSLTTAEGEDSLILAQICQLSLEFLGNITPLMRLDLDASRVLLLETMEKPVCGTCGDPTIIISSNIVASWILSACQSVLEITNTARLQARTDAYSRRLRRSQRLQQADLGDGQSQVTTATNGVPKRSSSLLSQTNVALSQTHEVDSPFEQSSEANGDANSDEKLGLSGLAGARGDVLSVARRTLSDLGAQCKGWLIDRNQLSGAEQLEDGFADVDLSGDQAGNASRDSGAPRGSTQNMNGILSASLHSALQSRTEFAVAYENMTTAALVHSTISGRSKMVEAAQADLAMLYYGIQDYEMATIYFRQLSLRYKQLNWRSISSSMLDVWATCLERLGSLRESVVIALRALRFFAIGQTSYSSRSGALRKLAMVAMTLDAPITASLDVCFRNFSLESHIHHANDRDEFWVNMVFDTSFEIDIEPGCFQVELQSARSGQSDHIRLSNNIRSTSKTGRNEIMLATNIVTSGWYKPQKVELRLGKIFFIHEPTPAADALILPDTERMTDAPEKNIDRSTRLLIWPHEQNLKVEVDPIPCIDLATTRALSIRIHAGWNNVLSGTVHLKSATPGLRLFIAEATALDAASLKAGSPVPNGIGFGKMHIGENITIKVPYSLENEYSEIVVRVTVDYNTPGGEFTFRDLYQVSHALALAVNVQDNFRKDRLFSRFIIASAPEKPVRVARCLLSDNESFKADGPLLGQSVSPSFSSQPLQLIAEIHRRNGQIVTPVLMPYSRRLILKVAYQLFCTELVREAEQRLKAALPTALRDRYCRALVAHLRAHFPRSSSHDLERWGLQSRYPLGTYSGLCWEDILASFPADDAHLLREHLQTFHKDNTYISVDGAPERSPVQELVIPVDVPELPVLHTVQIQLAGAWEERKRPQCVEVGETILAELTIEYTRRWGTRSPTAAASTFRYELQTDNDDDWVVGGQRGGVFHAQEEEQRTFGVLLLPRRTGCLILPSILIEMLARSDSRDPAQADGSAEEGLEWEACEVDCLYQAKTIQVTNAAVSRDIVVDLPLGREQQAGIADGDSI